MNYGGGVGPGTGGTRLGRNAASAIVHCGLRGPRPSHAETGTWTGSCLLKPSFSCLPQSGRHSGYSKKRHLLRRLTKRTVNKDDLPFRRSSMRLNSTPSSRQARKGMGILSFRGLLAALVVSAALCLLPAQTDRFAGAKAGD